MESLGAFPEGEWDSISRMFFTEESDFSVQLQYSFPNDHDEALNFGISSSVWSGDEANTNRAKIDDSLFYSSGNLNSTLFHFSQEGSYSSQSSVLLPALSQETYYLSDTNYIPDTNNTSETMEYCMMDEKNVGTVVSIFPNGVTEEVVRLNEEGELDGGHTETVVDPGKASLLKRKSGMPEIQATADEKASAIIHENPKKRARVSRDVQKIKKNVQLKKNQKLIPNGNDEEEINVRQNGQSSSSYSSEDDSNASQELNGGVTSDSKGPVALNLNGKTRAGRGSATDPQSLYARKRRERINERLKTLQHLVPNGTKVDISTMLEEAVHYVKFLQLQIKLLSSDDLWMYSPIAYNGMDIGLNRMISPSL